MDFDTLSLSLHDGWKSEEWPNTSIILPGDMDTQLHT